MSVAEESTFNKNEMFFSRTRKNGTILYGNSVFSRLSKYTMSEMFNKAHSIIRHPDMPRAVFKILWDEILAGRSISAYVKNKASDGSFYWVFASVFPFKNDFVSIRTKPTSPILSEHVEKLYKKLRADEANKNIEDQVKELHAEVLALGFRDYSHFMQAAMQAELKDFIQTQHGHSDVDPLISSVGNIVNGIELVLKKSIDVSSFIESQNQHLVEIQRITQAQELLPFNLTLSTQKSALTQKTMEVLSNLFSQQQRGVKEFLNKFSSVVETAKVEALGKLQYGISCCFLQAAMVQYFLKEISFITENEEKTKALQECEILISLMTSKFEEALRNINNIRSLFITILSEKSEMDVLVKSVLSIAQLGSVEINHDDSTKALAKPHLDGMRSMATQLHHEVALVGAALTNSSESLDEASQALLSLNKKCVQTQLKCSEKIRRTNSHLEAA